MDCERTCWEPVPVFLLEPHVFGTTGFQLRSPPSWTKLPLKVEKACAEYPSATSYHWGFLTAGTPWTSRVFRVWPLLVIPPKGKPRRPLRHTMVPRTRTNPSLMRTTMAPQCQYSLALNLDRTIFYRHHIPRKTFYKVTPHLTPRAIIRIPLHLLRRTPKVVFMGTLIPIASAL